MPSFFLPLLWAQEMGSRIGNPTKGHNPTGEMSRKNIAKNLPATSKKEREIDRSLKKAPFEGAYESLA